jgi:hypothetical protein
MRQDAMDLRHTRARATSQSVKESRPGLQPIARTFQRNGRDERYLELVVRGLLWTTGNLTADGKPAATLAR